MPGTFVGRIEALEKEVGDGVFVGSVVVDQVYAFNQEVGYWINFLGHLGFHTLSPRHGGTLRALAIALTEEEAPLMQKLAEALTLPLGLFSALVDGMEDIAAKYATTAPVEWGNLRLSGHPTVTDNGAVVYDRPPVVPRLSRAELAALGKAAGWQEAAYTEDRQD